MNDSQTIPSEIDLSAAQAVPIGKRITAVVLRGTGTQLVNESFEDFCARFSAFMAEEHSRGELFTFRTYYSWEATVDKITHMHVIEEPGAWSLDGCQDVQAINVQYITTAPIETGRERSAIAAPAPVVLVQHGPGKRGR
jgi:hypothetical protein